MFRYLFIQTLIDDYINPMIGQLHPDFTPLLMAIVKVAIFYLLGQRHHMLIQNYDLCFAGIIA